LIVETLEIVQAINPVIGFFLIYVFLKMQDLSEELIITVFTLIGVGCYFIFSILHKKIYSGYMMLSDFKTGIFLIGTLLFLTPVLKSLFVAYSDDTIVYIVVCKFNLMLIIKLYSVDTCALILL
jgi:hypothetical protein